MQYFNPGKVDTSDFECRQITGDEFFGMIDCANYTLNKPRNLTTRHERKLAKYLIKAVRWIEAEAYIDYHKDRIERLDKISREIGPTNPVGITV